MSDNLSEDEARALAKQDIDAATEYVQMMASGLREYAKFGEKVTRETQVATMFEAILETVPQGGTLLAAVAINMLAESDTPFEVADAPWFRKSSDEAQTMLRALGLIGDSAKP